MKGYKRIHGIAHCQDCDWANEDFLICTEEAKKHHKETGHKISIELGLTRTIKEENSQ